MRFDSYSTGSGWNIRIDGKLVGSGSTEGGAKISAFRKLGITLDSLCNKYDDLYQILMDFCGGPDARTYVGTTYAELEYAELEYAELEERLTPIEMSFLGDFFDAVEEIDTMRKDLGSVTWDK